ncbi:hypothetical protein EDC94DRAFT_646196 [Helicostylum pulchrum]|nr:hypothetical protein EDC94DRAFT_646196 [Helicostylum pulchrum]
MLGLKLSITSILLLFVMLQSYSVKGSYFCCSCFWLVYSERDFEVCGGYDNIHTGKGSCKTGWELWYFHKEHYYAGANGRSSLKTGITTANKSPFIFLENYLPTAALIVSCITSIDDLKNADSNGRDLFACFAQTDGHSISLQFVRKRRDKYSETPILALEDFSRTEVEENFLPCTIDPGLIWSVAVTQVADEDKPMLKIARNIKDIETNIPTAKTVNLETYKESAPFSFYDYQGRQRANAEAANTILNGEKKDEEKYEGAANIKSATPASDTKAAEPAAADTKVANPAERQKEKGNAKLEEKNRKWKPGKFVDSTLVPLVVFGDGMKQKDAVRLKKRLSGATNILYKEIICRQKQNLAAIVDINEFRTSVTCNMCKGEEKMKPPKLSNGVKVSGILECEKTCHLLWQRDVNATKNMLDIANSTWEGQGRPNPFNRPIDVEKTVSL